MSYMSELYGEIQTMLEDGYRPATIAVRLDVPVEWIYSVLEQEQEEGNTEVFSPHNTVNS